MSENNLKPCPFCGEELIINKGYYAHDLKMNEPLKCYAATWVFRVDDEESIRRWNTRKPIDEMVEALEKLKKLAENMRKINLNYKAYSEENYERGRIYAFDDAIDIVKECAE